MIVKVYFFIALNFSFYGLLAEAIGALDSNRRLRTWSVEALLGSSLVPGWSILAKILSKESLPVPSNRYNVRNIGDIRDILAQPLQFPVDTLTGPASIWPPKGGCLASQQYGPVTPGACCSRRATDSVTEFRFIPGRHSHGTTALSTGPNAY